MPELFRLNRTKRLYRVRHLNSSGLHVDVISDTARHVSKEGRGRVCGMDSPHSGRT